MFWNGKTAMEGLSGCVSPTEGFSPALGSAGELRLGGAAMPTSRPQRRDAVSVIALGVRPLDLRQTAKSAGGEPIAIIVQRADCVRGSERIASTRRLRRSGCFWPPRTNDRRVFEQAGRIILRSERGTCRERGDERENAASNESCDRLFHGAPASGTSNTAQIDACRPDGVN
jgi:hypothetical protein